MKKSRERQFIENTMTAAGEALLCRYDQSHQVTTKEDNSIVTEADLASEAVILQAIRRDFPSDTILSEEAGLSNADRPEGQRIWIIDPLDGTTNYANRYPFYCVSIGLGRFNAGGKVEMLAGGIFAPSLGETYYAEAGEGAFCNGQPLKVSGERPFEKSFLCTGFYYDQGDSLALSVERFARVAQACQAIRRDGSAALDLAYTAKGVFDGFWEIGLKPWDLAAGILLVQEAGGMIVNYPLGGSAKPDANAYDIEGVGIVCGAEQATRKIWAML